MSVGTDPLLGTDLAGYRLESVIGRGGMGVVYLAIDLRLERKVALKLVAPELAADPRFRERFLRESRLAASLDHSHVVPVHAAGETDGQLWLAMRYVEGEDLGTLLAREGRLEPTRAVELLGQVGEALDTAHEHGLVHRDVKPANVLVTREGGGEHCYLADFGLARNPGALQKPSPTHLSGTVDYTAPEQIAAEPADGRADVYSLGCVLYECLAGRPPFRRDRPASTLFAHLEEPPPSLYQERPELPGAIDDVITKALAKSPDQRHHTCIELCQAAAEALGVGLGLAAPRMGRRLLLLAALGGLAVAVAAAVPSILLTRGTNNPAKPTTVITRDTLQRIDPKTDKLVASIPYGQAGVEPYATGLADAGGFAVGEGAVWVFGPRIQTVLKIDPKTNAVVTSSAVSLTPESPAGWVKYSLDAGLGHIWVVTGTSAVIEIDPHTGVTTRQIPIPDEEASCTHVDASISPIWVWCNHGKGPLFFSGPQWVWSVDPQTEKAVRVVIYEDDGFRLARDPLEPPGQRTWLGRDAGFAGSVLALYDTTTTALLAEFELPFTIGGFDTQDLGLPGIDEREVGPGWVSNPSQDTVWELDPIGHRVARRIPVGRHPTGIDLSESDNAVWVANSLDGTVSRIDVTSGRVIETIEVGGRPQSVAVGEGGVWVSVYPA